MAEWGWWWNKVLGWNSVAERHKAKYHCQVGTGVSPISSSPFLRPQGDGNDEKYFGEKKSLDASQLRPLYL